MFGAKADQCFLDDVARFAAACQLKLQKQSRGNHGNSGSIHTKNTNNMNDVGTEPNATLDPSVLQMLEYKAKNLPAA
jgi:hypothetical protein